MSLKFTIVQDFYYHLGFSMKLIIETGIWLDRLPFTLDLVFKS
jgi:hypothetical protein